MTVEFLITSLVVIASPGTGVLVTLAAALAHGRRAAIVAAFGCTLGIVPHMLAAVTGLATVLHERRRVSGHQISWRRVPALYGMVDFARG